MRYLALDIGEHTTGVAFADSVIGISVPLDIIHHQSPQQLLECVAQLFEERQVEHVVIGLPLLMDGREGAQATFTHSCVTLLQHSSPIPISLLDERYTTPKFTTSNNPHSTAACQILSTFLDRQTNQAKGNPKGVDKYDK